MKYLPSEIESKWQKIWQDKKIYSPDLDTVKKPFYNLMMFPYPSAEGMHVGNMYAFTGSDIYGRFKRMQGLNVFEPIGLDGFGIHSENYAIKVGRHPKEQAKVSETNFYRQLHATGNGFDWSRTVETYDPEYYKWTQWIFIQLFKVGLAYRKKAPVNFCPSCKTVLADEQVIDGKCERCSSIIEKKDLEQWFFKITTYADRLLNNLENLPRARLDSAKRGKAGLDWTEKVKIAQRQWIGKSEGATIFFRVHDNVKAIEVFTTRPDTLYGATFLVLSPEHPVSSSIKDKKIQDYIKEAKKKTEQERVAEGKEKTGVFTGLYARNPLNEERIPVWIADYALMGYGTGALFGDAHDKRDVEFAKKYKIPLKPTIITGNKQQDVRIRSLEECFTGEGILIDSGPFSGLTSKEAKKKIVSWLEEKGSGSPQTTYHLRDWLISRQRYWGPPIPMIYCKKCDWQPVLEKDLPVLLPDVKDWKPKGSGKSPLANHPEFYKAKCPNCRGGAKRETDVSDTFLDSTWYYLGYLILGNQKSLRPELRARAKIKNQKFEWDKNIVKRWLPVNMYIGGAEHSVLHLLYSRFLTMVFKDLGLISFEEPFTTFRAHGLLISGGAKMSKSKGNVVIPDQYIKKYGADTLRTYLMFAGPFEQGGDFRDTGIEGMFRFLNRVWRLISERSENSENQNIRPSDASDNQKVRNSEYFEFSEHVMHKTIKKVTEDIENLRYNTAIASLMEYYNFLSKQKSVSKEELKTLVLLLAPFAPHMTEELWQRFRNLEVGNGKFLTPEAGNLDVLTSKNQEFKPSKIQGQEIRTSHFKNSKFESIHLHPWPSYDPKFLEEDEATIVVQVNGKVRDSIKYKVLSIKYKAQIEKDVRESERVKKYLEGKKVKKVVYVEGKIINFVVE